MNYVTFDYATLDRMVLAVEKVRNRLKRAATALDSAGIFYAVIGGNAVAAWVSQVDEAAIRNTQDVDFLLRREDLERAKAALGNAGFVYRHVRGIDMFLDGPGAKARDAVHVIFSGEKVRSEDAVAAPDASETEFRESTATGRVRLLTLEALVRMKLTAYRLKDQVHLQDMVQVGLIDQTWPAKFQPELGQRLQAILDNPDG
jgi:hypothetical protein